MKINLKQLKEEDLEYRITLLNHGKIAPYINSNEVFILNETINWFKTISKMKTRQDFVFIHENQNIGMGGVTNISTQNKNCELYMFINPNFQGKGLGFLSCAALCLYAFNNLNLEKIILYTFSSNIKANKLYERLGFKLEGRLRKHTFKSGKLKNRNIYGLLKSEIRL